MEKVFKDIRIAVNMNDRKVPQYHGWGGRGHNGCVYYHNVVFEDEFQITDFHTSRSSVYITIRSTNTGFTYNMRWWAMKDLFLHGSINNSIFSGYFTMKHAWDYTSVVMFDPKHLPKRNGEKLLAGPNWWDYAEKWIDDR